MSYLLTFVFMTLIPWGAVSANTIQVVPTKAHDLSAITVENVIELTNQSRADHGLPPLKENAYLDKLSSDRVTDEVTHDNFSHVDSHGKHAYDEVDTSIYPYRDFGENLAVYFTDAVKEQAAWDASPEHEANVLNPLYRDIGVAIQSGPHDGYDTTWVAVEFGDE